MKTSTVLTEARNLIRNTKHCKKALAKNKYRHAVSPTSPSAVAFCSLGAIRNILNAPFVDTFKLPVDDFIKYKTANNKVSKASQYLRLAMPVIKDGTCYVPLVHEYNDLKSTTPEDVDNWFTAAIELAKSEGN